MPGLPPVKSLCRLGLDPGWELGLWACRGAQSPVQILKHWAHCCLPGSTVSVGRGTPSPLLQPLSGPRALLTSRGLSQGWEAAQGSRCPGLPGTATFLLLPRVVLFSPPGHLPWPQTGLRATKTPPGAKPAGKQSGLYVATRSPSPSPQDEAAKLWSAAPRATLAEP